MFKPILRTLPLAAALACGASWAATPASGNSANTGPNHSTLAAVSAAQPGSPADTTHAAGANAKADAKLSRGDKDFIEDAAKGGMFEVQSGQLAAQKGADQSVKDFGNKLVQDHGKANDELKQIAEAKGVKMPDKNDWSNRHEISKLQKLSGPAFDREFAKNEVKDHEKDIKSFEKAASKLKDPDLKSWAEKQLPALKEHLALAEKLSGADEKSAMNSSSHTPNTRAAGNTGSSKTTGSKY
jgi:putative membrane protein